MVRLSFLSSLKSLDLFLALPDALGPTHDQQAGRHRSHHGVKLDGAAVAKASCDTFKFLFVLIRA